MDIKKLCIGLTVVFITLLAGFGCNSDNGISSKEDLYGTWELIELRIDFEGIPANIIEYLGIDITLDVREDGTYTMTTVKNDLEGPVTTVETGTWTAGTKKFTVNPDDETQDIKTMKYSVKGNTATLHTILPDVVDENDEDLMSNIPQTMFNTDGSLKDVPVTLLYQRIS